MKAFTVVVLWFSA